MFQSYRYGKTQLASDRKCDYVRHFEDGTDAELTKPSQAIA